MKQYLFARVVAVLALFFMAAAQADTFDISTSRNRLSDPLARNLDANNVIRESGKPRGVNHTYRITWGNGAKDSWKITPTFGDLFDVYEVPGSYVPPPTSGGGGGGGGTCVPNITVYGNYFETVATQGGEVISRYVEFIGNSVEISGCEGAGNPFGYP